MFTFFMKVQDSKYLHSHEGFKIVNVYILHEGFKIVIVYILHEGSRQ